MATADIPYPESIGVAMLFMFYLILVAIYMIVRPIGIYVGNKKNKEAEMIINVSITIWMTLFKIKKIYSIWLY